jgi:hypothetical protein
MAMNRRVMLPNIGAAVPFVHGRAHNSLDQDRQDFERNQVGLYKPSLTLSGWPFEFFFTFIEKCQHLILKTMKELWFWFSLVYEIKPTKITIVL